MNATVKPQPASPAPAPKPEPPVLLVSGRDREFLPAALEILETPPSPLPVAIALTICVFCVLALIWSYFGRLDIHAVAWGKIEANGRAKVIQPLDPGKVADIAVENGSAVKKGDLLIALDPAEAQADEAAYTDALNGGQAEIDRRRTAVKAARAIQTVVLPADVSKQRVALPSKLTQTPEIVFSPNVPEGMRERETLVITADFSQLVDVLKNLDKQMLQKDAMRKRIEMSIAYQTNLVKTLEQRVSMRESSIKLEVGTKVNLFDAQEALQKAQSSLASDQGQLIETDAALEEIGSQKVKALSQFIADNESKRADAARKSDDLTQQLSKARTKRARTNLYAPIDGVVQQLAVTTIGQVVTTGQQLMLLTPSSGALHVEAFVSNGDIGFVKVGQLAEVKIDAFPFTRFGTLHAKVVKIAADAIDEQDAKRGQSNATAAANSANQTPSSSPGQQQNFVFPVTLSLDTTNIVIDGATVPLTQGMTITVEIKTDSRRVIDYLLSPIAKTASEAMKER